MSISLKGAAAVSTALTAVARAAAQAQVTAINRTAEQARDEVRKSLPTRFTFRGTGAQFERSVIAVKSKRLGQPAAVQVGSGNTRTATGKLGALLVRHETAATSRVTRPLFRNGKFRGVVGHFLPAEGMRTDAANPPRRLYPHNIGVTIREWRDRRTGQNKIGLTKSQRRIRSQVTGQRETESFYVTERAGRATVWRRVNGGPSRPIWHTSQVIRRPARTRFVETAVDSARATYLGHAGQAMRDEMRDVVR